ncbi:Ycf51 family protein [Microcoleus sp. bin38.metabat.b11b12b14.051]|uniref:Ycf51 family protein n=1 Tax=Microcoleus sp. bin38.metabat.b11b12b14.051 TaxID=2742709 RepID=UPI0025CF75E7|nr:Ycf51 family protein [Microcoleus sp. bin38.metabat.b11b12b14.051]
MNVNSNLLMYAQWAGILTAALFVLTIIAFILKWGFRFRLVGVTSFMGVIAASIFGLGLGLFSRTEIPGAVRYSLVYDTGGAQTVVTVPPSITESELEATMRQVAADLYSPGRSGSGRDYMTIRVRTVVHPEPGLSQPLFLGEVRRSLATRYDDKMAIDIFPEKVATLKKYQA